MKIRIEKGIAWFGLGILLLFILAIGIYVGYKVTQAMSDLKTIRLGAQVERGQEELAEAKAEVEFWQSTLKGLVEGEQGLAQVKVYELVKGKNRQEIE